MKNSLFLIIILCIVITACSKKRTAEITDNKDPNVHATYDTVAIDSFSGGAVSVDVAAQIRRTSVAFQDSIKKEAAKQKEEAAAKLLADEKAKAEKEADKKLKEAAKSKEKPETAPEPVKPAK